MNIEFTNLKLKEVVNVADGRKLGKVVDLIIDCETTRIRGIVVPGEKGFTLFKSNDDLYIPFKNIKRIGDDVILVDVVFFDGNGCSPNCKSQTYIASDEDDEA